jgi:hypothetical protein
MSVRLNLEAFGTYKTTTNERKGNVIFNSFADRLTVRGTKRPPSQSSADAAVSVQ